MVSEKQVAAVAAIIRRDRQDADDAPAATIVAREILAKLDTLRGVLNDPKLAKACSHPVRAAVIRALGGAPNCEECKGKSKVKGDDGEMETCPRCQGSGRKSMSPNELSRAIGVDLGVTSYHVRMLRDYGVVVLVDTAPRRGALEHYYTLTDNGTQVYHELPAQDAAATAASTSRFRRELAAA